MNKTLCFSWAVFIIGCTNFDKNPQITDTNINGNNTDCAISIKTTTSEIKNTDPISGVFRCELITTNKELLKGASLPQNVCSALYFENGKVTGNPNPFGNYADFQQFGDRIFIHRAPVPGANANDQAQDYQGATIKNNGQTLEMDSNLSTDEYGISLNCKKIGHTLQEGATQYKICEKSMIAEMKKMFH